MKKSVYSIVLADKVVEEIDKMAFMMNTSRSNLINQILAEKVGLLTPEMRMNDIFRQISEMMNDSFALLDRTSDSIMSMKSTLLYKYRPTVKYKVELFRDLSGCVGRLTVSFRSQNQQLLRSFSDFFKLWKQLETKYIGRYFKGEMPFGDSQGGFERYFYQTGDNCTDSQISDRISGYIRLIDSSMKLYFNGAEIEKIEKLYCEDLKNVSDIL